LAEAIDRLALDAPERERLGQAGRTEFEREYREDRMLSRYMELYARLLRASEPERKGRRTVRRAGRPPG
jgi:glycosyltransferase involved in cell wall biosynthesis